jgi:DNA-binding response OmpR family regulator
VCKICYRASQALLAFDHEDFDLAIIDINIEDEMSGFDLSNFIKQKKLSLPFIFLTS